MESFVKLNRSIMEWRWYHDPAMTHLFLHLVMRANYTDADWQDITVRRGQLVTSRHALAAETGLTEKVIRRCLHQLEKTGEISITPTNHYSLIAITKYTDYQGEGAPMGQQGADERPTEGQQRATIKEDKKERNEEKAILFLASSKEPLMAEQEIDYQTFMDFFNRTMQNRQIPQIEGINGKSQDLLNACYREFGKEALLAVVQKAAASNFLNGGGRTFFLARFDWIFTPTNFCKILAGKYDDNVKNNKNSYGTDNHNTYRTTDDLVNGAAGIIRDLRSGCGEPQKELPVV